MRTTYKGFNIEVKREKCLGGWSQLYWTVIRESDGWEMICNFADTKDTERTLMECMKMRVDDYLEDPALYERDEEWN